MPEHLLYRFDVGAGRHRQTGRGVPQVVWGRAGYTGRFDGLAEPAVLAAVALHIAAVPAREQQRIAIAALALARQVGQQERWQWHGALLVTFRGADEYLRPDLHGVLRDGDAPAQHVKVTDTQPDRFAPAQPGVGQQQHQRLILARGRGERRHLPGHEALTKWVTPARDRFRDRQREAVEHNDKLALEELQLFRKDVGSYLRQYDFLSQIVNYEDISLEKLSIYLRHLAPVIAESQLNHEIDLSTVDFDYIAQHKQDTTSAKPTGGVELEPVKESGTGTARDPELVALEEVIAQINDLFSGDHPDSSVRNVVTHIKDRLEESETLQQQAQNNSLAQFTASPDLKSEFVSAVIGAMESHSDLSTQILNNPELKQKLLGELVPLIFKELKATA